MIEQKSETELLFEGETPGTGLHARSSAHVVRWTAGLDARVTVRRPGGEAVSFVCYPPSPGALLRLIALGARPGEALEITAEGEHAEEAIVRIRAALAEEPPPGHDRERLGAWDARVRSGMPSRDPELDGALRRLIDATTRPSFTEEERDLIDEHLWHAKWCAEQWEDE